MRDPAEKGPAGPAQAALAQAVHGSDPHRLSEWAQAWWSEARRVEQVRGALRTARRAAGGQGGPQVRRAVADSLGRLDREAGESAAAFRVIARAARRLAAELRALRAVHEALAGAAGPGVEATAAAAIRAWERALEAAAGAWEAGSPAPGPGQLPEDDRSGRSSAGTGVAPPTSALAFRLATSRGWVTEPSTLVAVGSGQDAAFGAEGPSSSLMANPAEGPRPVSDTLSDPASVESGQRPGSRLDAARGQWGRPMPGGPTLGAAGMLGGVLARRVGSGPVVRRNGPGPGPDPGGVGDAGSYGGTAGAPPRRGPGFLGAVPAVGGGARAARQNSEAPFSRPSGALEWLPGDGEHPGILR